MRMAATIVVAVIASSSAHAQSTSIDWSNGACYEAGLWWPSRSPGQCFAEDKRRVAQTAPPPGIDGRMLHGSFAISSRVPRCPDGYSLVDAGRPMCARDLREPDY